MEKKLIIVGAGPAGLAAAVAACDAGIPSQDILLIERDKEPGGILNQCIHAGFGLHRFGEELTGPEYAGRFIDEVKQRNIDILTDAMVLSITKEKDVTFLSPQTGLVTLKAGAIILAMGCRERNRGALNIPGTRPAGIYSAGTAQRYVNIEGYLPGKNIVILGSGDIGLIMARRLTLEGANVSCVCDILPYSGGLERNIVQCLDDFQIPLKLSTTVIKIEGKNRVESVTIAKVDESNGRKPIPGTEETIPCDTLLLSCGLIPENELSRSCGIEIDSKTGGALVDENRETSVEGIFACGNVLHVHDLVDFVSDEAEIAGKSAAKYLSSPITPKEKVSIIPEDGIRYTVPQFFHKAKEGNLRIFFRVTAPMKPAVFTASDNQGNVLFSQKKRSVAPGEMESFLFSLSKLPDSLSSIHFSMTEDRKDGQ